MNETIAKFLGIIITILIMITVLWNIGVGNMLKTETTKLNTKMDSELVNVFR